MPKSGITGPEQLVAVAKALREAPKDVRRESYAAMARAVRPLSQAVKAAAPRYMPARYGVRLAKSLRVRTQRRTGRNAGVTLIGSAKGRGTKGRDVGALNKGMLRKPLFGNRGHWYPQNVRPGFWDEPLEQNADVVRKELMRVLDGIAKRIASAD